MHDADDVLAMFSKPCSVTVHMSHHTAEIGGAYAAAVFAIGYKQLVRRTTKLFKHVQGTSWHFFSNIPLMLHHRQCGGLCDSHTAVALLCHPPTWAARYSACLPIKLMLKGVVSYCIFMSVILGKSACVLTVLEKT